MPDTIKSPKSAALETLEHLPDNTTWDEAMYHLCVRLKIENGLRDAANGNIVTDADVRRMLGKTDGR